MGASDLSSIEEVLSELGDAANDRHRLQQVDLTDAAAVAAAVQEADPDLVIAWRRKATWIDPSLDLASSSRATSTAPTACRRSGPLRGER